MGLADRNALFVLKINKRLPEALANDERYLAGSRPPPHLLIPRGAIGILRHPGASVVQGQNGSRVLLKKREVHRPTPPSQPETEEGDKQDQDTEGSQGQRKYGCELSHFPGFPKEKKQQ